MNKHCCFQTIVFVFKHFFCFFTNIVELKKTQTHLYLNNAHFHLFFLQTHLFKNKHSHFLHVFLSKWYDFLHALLFNSKILQKFVKRNLIFSKFPKFESSPTFSKMCQKFVTMPSHDTSTAELDSDVFLLFAET